MDKAKLAKNATQSGIWFAITSFIGQAISWVFTFYVIRLLDPKDFGLMTMASLLTAYLQMFSELGVGATIIQRPNNDQGFLSTVFWLVLLIGSVMGLATLGLAYPTAWIFSNKNLIPITQFISILFIVGALSTVPYHLLARDFEFKKIGLINLISTLTASVVSVVLALKGYGVYTLIWTNICQNGMKAILFFIASRWRPSFHFALTDIKSSIGYGATMALSGTSLKLQQTLDKLVVGRFFGENQLGFYQNAISISSMPLDKIWPIFQQILFPLFSRLRDDRGHCNKIYLETLKNYLLIVAPIYLGSAIVADDLVLVILGKKWLAMTPIFQMFCGVKLFQVLTAYHVTLDNSTGRHNSALLFNFASAVLIPGLMWIGSYHSFAGGLSPWISAYPLLCIVWLFWSLQKNQISASEYLLTLGQGFFASLIMATLLIACKMSNLLSLIDSTFLRLIIEILISALTFCATIVIFQRPTIISTINLIKNKQAP